MHRRSSKFSTDNNQQCLLQPRPTTRSLYLYRSKDIPISFREKHLQFGYRQVPCSLPACIYSIFTINNETFNFWTHFIPFLVSLHKIYTFPDRFNYIQWPFLAYTFSCSGLFLVSSLAHMLAVHTATFRHICWFHDYAAICFYSIGVGIVYDFSLNNHINGIEINPKWEIHKSTFILSVTLCSFIALYMSCITRCRTVQFRYFFRVISFGLPWYFGVHYFIKHWIIGDLFFNIGKFGVSILPYFMHNLWMIIGAFFHVTKFPEKSFSKVFPGICILGHSHQWMHVCTAVGIFVQWSALENQIHYIENNLDVGEFIGNKPIVCYYFFVCIFLMSMFVLRLAKAWKSYLACSDTTEDSIVHKKIHF